MVETVVVEIAIDRQPVSNHRAVVARQLLVDRDGVQGGGAPTHHDHKRRPSGPTRNRSIHGLPPRSKKRSSEAAAGGRSAAGASTLLAPGAAPCRCAPR